MKKLLLALLATLFCVLLIAYLYSIKSVKQESEDAASQNSKSSNEAKSDKESLPSKDLDLSLPGTTSDSKEYPAIEEKPLLPDLFNEEQSDKKSVSVSGEPIFEKDEEQQDQLKGASVNVNIKTD